jgi:hypothetical protein
MWRYGSKDLLSDYCLNVACSFPALIETDTTQLRRSAHRSRDASRNVELNSRKL